MQTLNLSPRSANLIIRASRSLQRQRRPLIPGKRLIRISDLRSPMRRRLTLLIEINEHHLLDGQNTLPGNLIAHFAPKRNRRTTEMRSRHPEFNDVSLPRGADKINLGHELGHNPLVVELTDCIDSGFFVDPAQEAATEQRTVGVEIFGLDPLPGMKIHLVLRV